jgi:Fe-S cluster assembly protein SufB
MANEQIIDKLKEKYALGFSLELENETVPKGLSEEVIILISTMKQEPQWLLEWRLNAYRHWLTLKEPQWANIQHPPIDYQDLYYYSAPKKAGNNDGEKKEIDPELMAYYEKLGVPLNEREILSGNMAVDAIMDSVSVGTTFKARLEEAGVLFCSFSEAVQKYPDLVQKYLGSVVSYRDNYFASLNSAVFTDGSFCFIPAGVKCPMELSTYFRINQAKTGQFERTLIIAEEGASVRYLEGCFLAGTPIWTPEGVKRIEEVELKDNVYDHEGNVQKVKALMRRPYEGDIYSINPVGSQKVINATSEHPFWVIPRDKIVKRKARQDNYLPEISNKKLLSATPEWVEAKNLKEGDFVFMPIVKTIDSQISESEAELLGWYLAEGSSYFNQNIRQYVNQFSLNIKEIEEAERIAELVLSKFGKKVYFTEEKEKNGLSLSFFSKEAHDWFIYHCGKGALNKKLSPELINMPESSIHSFIESYLKGDGNIFYRNHLRKDGTVKSVESRRLCTSSPMLVQDLVLLLARIDIFSAVVERLAGEDSILGRTIYRQESWQIIWTPKQKFNQVQKTETGYWIPIRSIKKQYQETMVYNFEVSNTNTYLAQGIAVHNCSAPSRPENQLHAAVVELIALEKAKIEYSTVQNWYPGDENGNGGIYNFVTKRGECRGDDSEISWTQIETGSAITWKYPSVILRGKRSKGYFYSVALTNHYQQADTGTKMIHLGEHTSSTIIAKSISAGKSVSTYRGLVRIAKKALKARNFTQCDSLIFGQSKVHTDPYIENHCFSAKTEHEATTSPISDEHLFYLMQHGLNEEQAKNMLVNGFCKSVFQKLPGEFAVEAQRLLEINLEGSMG